ncbi:unnamed protein product [Meganyctiphanes norvegica]|uniref:G protein alpha subunit n=1 Tax=Meganyctiphanes norvegica TaxID=48144 RepID=A0AAV2RA75_MEGNR
MGFRICGSDPERRKSKEIEKKINTWMKDYNKVMKMLLLGAGESGKTTIIKQMKILHINGFSKEEFAEKRCEVRSNIFESITTLLSQLDKQGLQLQISDSLIAAEYIRNNPPENPDDMTQQYYTCVQQLWRDGSIQNVYNMQNKYQLIDCAKYFLDKIDVIRDVSYEPSEQDILYSRKRTTDIQEIQFEMKIPKKFGGGKQLFKLFDVGGQRGERKKWVQLFDGIQVVLFLVSASSFDMRIAEDETTNRFQESLELFEFVWTTRFLREAGTIIFLNKQDILKQKIIEEKKNIGDYFPEYQNYKLDPKDKDIGENEDYLRTRCFIRDKFMGIAKTAGMATGPQRVKMAPGFSIAVEEKPRHCYSHFTTATDTNNVKLVFDDVHSMIITRNLSALGIQ